MQEATQYSTEADNQETMDIQQALFAILEITINNLYKNCLNSFTRIVNTLTIATERFLSYLASVSLSPATSASDSERHQELLQGIFTLPIIISFESLVDSSSTPCYFIIL